MICVICFGAPHISGLAADNGLSVPPEIKVVDVLCRIFCAGESQKTTTYQPTLIERTYLLLGSSG